ncbi:MAG: indole-3-glycerol phosphate synthase TrpC [Hyphomonadaceae bacterium]
MSDTLQHILAYKAEEVAAGKRARPLAAVEDAARAAPAVRPFADALGQRAQTGFALIGEIKKASPSRGLIRADFDPASLAEAYMRGGAAALSVLTDAPSFQGEASYLAAARAACTLPVLRKDFMIDPWQIAESRALGADAILIIMAAVSDGQARELADAAAQWGMTALVECHDEAEMARALRLSARLIGVNNRDLRTFDTHLETTERLAPLIPFDRLLVAESGIFTHAHLQRLARCGARAFLVGEALMKQSDVAAATRALLGGDATPG